MSTGDLADVGDIFRLAGATLEGRFSVERAIAEGGFGVVYRAQQTALERPVALKVLKTPPEFGDFAREQFLNVFATEAKTIARITHPNIVQVHDFGVSTMPSGERAAWMALEWLTGSTLEEELLARRGRGGQSPAECLRLLRPVLSALATVHAAGVAHRDLKPANIMLVGAPGGTVPKLLDFGIAKIMDRDEGPGTGHTATRSRQIAFSPAYASPEQVSHGRSGPWTDVHALSLLLTEMLTDRPPLSGEDTTTLFQQILDRTRPTPARFGVLVGPWESVLARASAVAPGDRHKDAGQLLEALESTLGEASAAYAASPAAEARMSGPIEAGPIPDTILTMSRRQEPVAARTPLVPTVMRTGGQARSLPWSKRSLLTVFGSAIVLSLLGAVAMLVSGSRPTVAIATTSNSVVAEAVESPPNSASPEAPKPPATGAAAPSSAPEPLPPTMPPAPPAALGAIPPSHSVAPRPATPLGRHSPPPVAASATPTATPARRVNCDPPFTVDATGKKHYKPECDN